ncbi:MAG: hypothetical protein Q8O14_06065 [bacterium]|jgi:hypothetical protein|nr:hypothetical protein [bacterium]
MEESDRWHGVSMVAAVVVAVDVSHPLLDDKRRGPIDVMRQACFIIQMHNVDHRRSQADLLVRPDLDGLDFHKVEAARRCLPEPRILLEEKGWAPR